MSVLLCSLLMICRSRALASPEVALVDSDDNTNGLREHGNYCPGFTYVEESIAGSGNWLIGGDLEVIEPIKYHDGLDHFDCHLHNSAKNSLLFLCIPAQNPVHNGHALLIQILADAS
uniref:Sulphate adenylyltransferase catalytic domain-containing protein n=1 Tax=Salix viminalis TaxID=40686 RepID=A0A6N2MSF8_SALVM